MVTIADARVPRSCTTLDGKYCFYIEQCKAFRDADFITRRHDGVKGRLEGCPLEEHPKNGTSDNQPKSELVPLQAI